MIEATRSQPGRDGGTSLLGALSRGWWIIAVCVAAAGAGVFGFLSTRPPSYEASALLHIEPTDRVAQILGVGPADADPVRAIAEAIPQIDQQRTAQRTLERLRFKPPLSPDQIQAATDVGIDETRGVVAVTSTRSDPDEAARIANAYARAYIDRKARETRTSVRTAIGSLQAQLDRDAAAQRRDILRSGLSRAATRTALLQPTQEELDLRRVIRQLALVLRVSPADVSLSRAAEPPQAASGLPAFVLSGGGAVLGLVLGMALVIVRAQTDHRLRSDEDFERALGRPVLGRLRLSSEMRAKPRAIGELHRREAEPLRNVLARLRYSQPVSGARSVVVTGLNADDGHQHAAWYLAAAAAAAGDRVLLVDSCTPLRPVPNGAAPVLEDVLDDKIHPTDAVHRVDVAYGQLHQVARGRDNGVTPLSRPDGVRALVDWGRSAYDLILIQTSPLVGSADAVPFANSADGVVVTSRRNAHPDQAAEMRAVLELLDLALTGVIVIEPSRR